MTAPLWRYLFDTSALVNLVNAGNAGVRVHVRVLTGLVNTGVLHLPERVAKEIRRRDDRLKHWVERHPEAVIRETTENTVELERVARAHRDVLGPSRRSADAVLVAMALYYPDWTVVADDTGIQAACFREGLQCLTSLAFRRVQGL